MVRPPVPRTPAGGRFMFGLEDPTILFGYGLAIGLTIICIVYGWLKKDEEG